jgi:hypothetical protein
MGLTISDMIETLASTTGYQYSDSNSSCDVLEPEEDGAELNVLSW